MKNPESAVAEIEASQCNLAKAEIAVDGETEGAKKEKRNALAKAKREAAKIAKQQQAVASVTKERAAKGLLIPPEVKKSEWGTIYDTYDNCWQLLAMNAETWGMGYDTLKESYVFRGGVLPWPEHYGRELTDDLIRAIRNWMLDDFGTEFKKSDIEDALLTLCYARPFNPICEYLDKVQPKWDGVRRIDTWLHVYLGAPVDPYHSAIGRLWLLGAVARARKPGTKFDTALIIEAIPGTGKSTALEILASAPWFSDAPIENLRNRDAAIALQGIWIYEFGELNDVTRSDVNSVKQFLSTSTDRYRGVNAKRRSDHPRGTVFCGTTNQIAYLMDMTGDRRFWPCRTEGEVKLEAIARDRDMLWAEAAAVEANGASLTLPRELWPVAAKEQAERRINDPWVDSIKAWLADEGDRVHLRDILEKCFEIAKGNQRTDHGKRVAAAMQAIGGWRHRPKLRIGKITGLSGYARESIMKDIEKEETDAGAA